MKQCIAIISMLFFMHSINAKAIHPSTNPSLIIQPVQDSIPFKPWSYGVQTNLQKNGSVFRSLNLGLFAERRISSSFALEAELGFSRNYVNLWLFTNESYTNNRLNFALSAKIYFGEKKRWFAKAGYGFKPNVFANDLDLNSLILGIGHNLELKNGGAIKFEYNTSYNSINGLTIGPKIGYRF